MVQFKILYLCVFSRAARLPLPGCEQRAGLCRDRQVERANGDAAPVLVADAGPVGHRVDASVVENDVRMDARQLRGAKVRGGGHDVRGDDRVLDHLAVNGSVVAAGTPVAAEHGMVGGGQERSGAARQVGDSEVGIGVEVVPVGVQARDGQFRKKRRAGGERVEGGEEFPVDDQVLEHASGQVVARSHADVRKAFGCCGQRGEHAPSRRGAQGGEKVGCDLEYRPVVYIVENVAPCIEKA